MIALDVCDCVILQRHLPRRSFEDIAPEISQRSAMGWSPCPVQKRKTAKLLVLAQNSLNAEARRVVVLVVLLTFHIKRALQIAFNRIPVEIQATSYESP